MVKQRKIPQRKCVVTNVLKPKKEMIRVVRNKEGEVSIDHSGKKNGRGAYVTIDKAIIEQAAEHKVLNKVFGMNVDAAIYEELLKLVEEE